MGKNDDAGEETRVECTYYFCRKAFPNEKQMKRHKKAEPDHFYCKKCDVDCKDWEDELQHKVNAMQPFLENRMKDEPDAKLMHIVCEFCGKDFGSFGGRKLHRQQVSSN